MGSPGIVLLHIVSSFIGLSCMAVTFHGYLFRDLNWVERLLFLIGGLALVYPHYIADIAGYLLIAVLVSRELLKQRSQKALGSTGME
jgi:TRAP-type uncharacterized transport system fused permease subunit